MKIRRLSEEHLRIRVKEILADWPVLNRIDPTDFCCSGCAYSEIGQEYSWPVADAWEELQSLYFLLDESN